MKVRHAEVKFGKNAKPLSEKLKQGTKATPMVLYAAMIFLSAATCLGTVIFLHYMIRL